MHSAPPSEPSDDDFDDFDDDIWLDEDPFDDDPFDEDEPAVARLEPLGVDGNGLLTEQLRYDDQSIIVHRDDVPESDITILNGIRVTTALRTVIDIAPDVPWTNLADIVEDCFERGLFTAAEAWRRIDQPDMVDRRGADLLRRLLPPTPR